MKIIFLDVDGVMNNANTIAKTSDGWCFVDDYLVERVGKVVKETGAKVVLSSSWRDGWDAEEVFFVELRAKLAEYGIELYDKTGRWRRSRGQEVGEWLSAHNDVENYAIIDDIADFDRTPPEHIFITNSWYGINENDVNDIIEFLNGEAN